MMKKFLCLILAVSMTVGSFAAFAETVVADELGAAEEATGIKKATSKVEEPAGQNEAVEETADEKEISEETAQADSEDLEKADVGENIDQTNKESGISEAAEEEIELKEDTFAETTSDGNVYISVGETKTAVISSGGQYTYFYFQPEEAGKYIFYSTSDLDTYGYVYDENMNQLASDDDGGEDRNFKVSYTMTAGTLYILGARYYNSSNTGSFDVTLMKAPTAKSISEDVPLHLELNMDEWERVAFIPPESGYYIIYGANYHYGKSILDLHDQNDCHISGGQGMESTKKITAYLEKDVKYYIYAAGGTACDFDLIVSKAVSPTGIKVISNEQILMYVGDRETMKVAFDPWNSIEEKITWTSSNESVASLSNKGEVYPEYSDYLLYNAADVLAKTEGAAVITATTESGFSAVFSVTVRNRPEAEAISFKSSEQIYYLDEESIFDSTGFSVSVEPYYANVDNITFTSSNESVANICDIQGSWVYIHINSVGQTVITATTDNGLSATCNVIVKQNRKPESISFCSQDFEVYVDEWSWLDLVISPEDSSKNYSGYYSSDENVVPLSKIWLYDGNDYIIIIPESIGQTEISVTTDNGLTAICTVTVKARPSAEAFSFLKQEFEADVGDSLGLFNYNWFPEDCEEEYVELTSSDESIVSIYWYGDEEEMWREVRPVSPGQATITGTTESGLTATCIVTVKEPESLLEGVETTAIFADEYSTVTYKFVPEVSGEYIISIIDASFDCSIFDNEGRKIGRFDWEDTPYSVSLSGSKEYYFRIRADFDANTYPYDFKIIVTRAALSGTCGTNAEWTLSGGTLTISGSGAISNYANKTAMPWYEYVDDIEEIIVDDGVTAIGNYAFMGCTNLTSVTLGNTVTSIGVNAFSGCAKLSSISLPASLTSISNYAFNNCSALSLIEFNSVAAPTLGANALANTKATAIYKSSWTNFAKDKFGGKTTWLIDHVNGSCGATKYSLDRGVMTISGKGTIRGYSKGEAPWYSLRDEIQNVVIGDSVTSIGNYAFYGCENLSELTLGSGVTTIGTSAFYGCASLNEVTFPASLTNLGAYAFSNCSSLAELTFNGETAPTIAATALNTVKAKAVHADNESWNSFNKTGFGGAIYWTDDPEEEIIGGSCGNQAAWILVDGTLTIYGEKGTKGYSKKTDVPWYEYRDQITKIVVEDGITSLGNYQFMECENVTEVYLSNTLTFIGVNAFSTCRSLTTITIPATVNTINGYAFNKCVSLDEVVFEGYPATISGTAFANTGAGLK